MYDLISKQEAINLGLKRYFSGKPCKHGHLAPRTLKGQCMICADNYIRDWQRRNREKTRIYTAHHRGKTPKATLQSALKAALKRRPCDNPVTLDYLLEMFENQNGRCSITGVSLTWGLNGTKRATATATSISLDRIDPKGGYTKENVRIVCCFVNIARNSMNDHEFYDIACKFIRFYEETYLKKD